MHLWAEERLFKNIVSWKSYLLFFHALGGCFTDLSFWLLLYWQRERDGEIHSYF